MKKLKNIGSVCVGIVIIALFSTVLNYNNGRAFDDIIYFLTIATGFNITAFSIIANSPFSSKLHNIEDKNDNSKTLLHVLVNKFRNSTLLFLCTIALILFYYFINSDTNVTHVKCEIYGYTITFPVILKSTIWYLTIISFIKFYSLSKVFSQFVIKSAE